MRIVRLAASNFKGQNFNHGLKPVTLITGRNSAGKSARLEALNLAALGYIPADPNPIKSARQIYDLYSSGNPMRVGFETDGVLSNDLSTMRTWTEERGSVRYAGPDGPVLPDLALDPARYFQLTGPARLALLFKSQAAGSGLTTESVRATVVANLKNIKLESNTPASEVVISEAVNLANPVARASEINSAQDYLEVVMDIFKTRKLGTDQSVKRMQQTLQGMTQARSEAAPLPDAEAKLVSARARLQEANAEVTRIETLLTECRRQWREADALAKLAPEAEAMNAELAEKESELAALGTVAEPDEAGLSEKQRITNALASKANQAATEVARLEADLHRVKRDDKCHACGQSIKKLQAKVAAELAAKLTEAAKASLEVGAEYAAAEKESGQKAVEVSDQRAVQSQAMRLVQAVSSLQNKLANVGKATEAAGKLPVIGDHGIVLNMELMSAKAAADNAKKAEYLAQCEARLLLAAKADAAARARAADELDKARVEAEIFGEAVKMLATLRAELVTRAIRPLVGRMNELCGPILPHAVDYLDGEIMLGSWSHRTASDSEKLAIYAAMCLALATESPIRLAVISRFESFDEDRGLAVVKLVTDLIAAEKLDQCILVEVGHGRLSRLQDACPDLGVINI